MLSKGLIKSLSSFSLVLFLNFSFAQNFKVTEAFTNAGGKWEKKQVIDSTYIEIKDRLLFKRGQDTLLIFNIVSRQRFIRTDQELIVTEENVNFRIYYGDIIYIYWYDEKTYLRFTVQKS